MPDNRAAAAWAVLMAMLLAVAGCSPGGQVGSMASGGASAAQAEANAPGDIPDNQVYITVQVPGGQAELTVPEGWAETTRPDSVAFTDKLNGIDLQVTARTDPPTLENVSADPSSQLTGLVTNPVVHSVAAFTRPGGDGVLLQYTGDASPDTVTGKTSHVAVERYLFWKEGRQATLTLSGPVEADNVDPWTKVSGSFRWLP